MILRLSITNSETRENRRAANWFTPSWFTPSVTKIAVWALLLGWSAWIASQWAREALAQRAPISAAQPRPAIDLDATVAQAAAVPLFGEAARSDAVQAASPTVLNIKLKGVFASGGGPMAAIVNMGGEDQFVALDKELGPGVVLQGVYPTHIVVSHDGSAERVELEVLKSADASRPTAGAAAARTRHLRDQTALPLAPAPEAAPAAPSPVAEAVPSAPDTPSVPLPQPMTQSQGMPDALSKTHLTGAETMLQQHCPHDRVVCRASVA